MFGSASKVSINNLVDTTWGSSPDSKTYNDTGDGVPFYQGKTEFGDLYINEPTTYCTAPVRMTKKHAILMSVRAPVGSVNIATQECCIGRGLASITPKEGKSTTMFVFYALRYMEEEIERLGTGSTFKAINKDSYAKIQMPNVNIEQQQEFVKIAEQADKSKFTHLKSQFIEMFGNVEDTRSLCEICRPKQWPTIPTKDFTEDGYLVYGANGVIGHYSEFNHEYPTILMACRGASCGAINISQPNSYITGNAMCMDEIIPEVSFEYLAYFLSNYDYKTIITGGAQPQITYTNLKKVMVPIPPYSEQQNFALIYQQADKSKLIRYS